MLQDVSQYNQYFKGFTVRRNDQAIATEVAFVQSKSFKQAEMAQYGKPVFQNPYSSNDQEES